MADRLKVPNAIGKKLPTLKEKYKDDSEALEVLKIEGDEMRLYRENSEHCGYLFYIGEKMKTALQVAEVDPFDYAGKEGPMLGKSSCC